MCYYNVSCWNLLFLTPSSWYDCCWRPKNAPLTYYHACVPWPHCEPVSKKIGTGVPTKTGGGFPAEGRKGGIKERKTTMAAEVRDLQAQEVALVALVVQQHRELLVARCFCFSKRQRQRQPTWIGRTDVTPHSCRCRRTFQSALEAALMIV